MGSCPLISHHYSLCSYPCNSPQLFPSFLSIHMCCQALFFSFFFLKGFIYLLLGKGREGEREGEKHQCVVAFHAPPTWDLACNPGMCPDWELNLDPLVHRLALNPLSHTSQGNCCQALLKNEDVEDVYMS